MPDWPKLRLQIQLWLHQSWPFRVLAWVRMRGVPDAQSFGKFRDGSEALEETVTRLRAEIAKLESQEAAVSSENSIAREAGPIEKLREDRPESAAELLAAAQTVPSGHINLCGQPCSQEDADAVLTAADPLQAARDLMTRKLKERERK